MRVIVTRVQPQADRWVAQLSGRFDALALPLIEVQAMPDAHAVQAAGQRWPEYAAVMFVSSHAVHFFFQANAPLLDLLRGSAPAATRAWATGPGTRGALLACGVAAAWVDAPSVEAGQFDSEALWHTVRNQIHAGSRVLIVRGDHADSQAGASPGGDAGVGRDWMAQQLRTAGAQVDFVVAYGRAAPRWQASERTLASQAAFDGSVWIFSSTEAVSNLATLLPQQDWSQARAVATHERIAMAARTLGFGVVLSTRPAVADVVASLESLA